MKDLTEKASDTSPGRGEAQTKREVQKPGLAFWTSLFLNLAGELSPDRPGKRSVPGLTTRPKPDQLLAQWSASAGISETLSVVTNDWQLEVFPLERVNHTNDPDCEDGDADNRAEETTNNTQE